MRLKHSTSANRTSSGFAWPWRKRWSTPSNTGTEPTQLGRFASTSRLVQSGSTFASKTKDRDSTSRRCRTPPSRKISTDRLVRPLTMRHYMSRVEFHGRGNVVEMEKRVTGSVSGSNGTLGRRGDRVQLGSQSGAPNPSSLNHRGKVESEIQNGHSTGSGAFINANLRVTGST